MKHTRRITGNPLKEFEERYKLSSDISNITDENFDSKLGVALNSYSRTYDSKDSKRFLLEFYPDSHIASVDEVTYYGYTTLGFIAKFYLDNKLNLDCNEKTKAWFIEKIEELKSSIKEKAPKDPKSLKERGQHIQQAIINRVREAMGAIDQYIDDNKYQKKWDTTFDIVEWLIAKNLSGVHARKMTQRLQNEQKEFKDIEYDEQLKEGYKFLSKKQIQYIIDLYDYVIGEFEKFINLQTNKRKQVAKPKAVKLETVVKDFHFLKEHDDLHLASINPITIIGSQACILYNVKYRLLRCIVANDSKGLQIKGSTIYNFDEKKSFEKSVRKPLIVIDKIPKASKKEFYSIIDTLTTKPFPTTGRSNNDCLILNVYR